MPETEPLACYQLSRTVLACKACGKLPDVLHVPTRHIGYFCEQCCPACREKPAAKGE
jgi:hypothetical protein